MISLRGQEKIFLNFLLCRFMMLFGDLTFSPGKITHRIVMH